MVPFLAPVNWRCGCRVLMICHHERSEGSAVRLDNGNVGAPPLSAFFADRVGATSLNCPSPQGATIVARHVSAGNAPQNHGSLWIPELNDSKNRIYVIVRGGCCTSSNYLGLGAGHSRPVTMRRLEPLVASNPDT